MNEYEEFLKQISTMFGQGANEAVNQFIDPTPKTSLEQNPAPTPTAQNNQIPKQQTVTLPSGTKYPVGSPTVPINGNVENPLTPNAYKGLVEYNPTQNYSAKYNLVKDLIADKQNYMAAQNAYNELEKQLPNLTGNAKTQAEQQMSAFQNAMNEAKKSAEKHREYGGMFGINTDLVGSKVSLQDAQIALEDMASNARNNLLYGNQFRRTADQYFEDEYQNYIQQGRSHRDATILAGDKAAKYQAQRIAALNQGLDLFGFDGENRLNKFGIQMLQEIAKENPADVAMYGNFANPKNQYDNDFAVSMANLAHTLGVDMKTVENMLGMQRDTHQSGLRINEANNNYNNQAKLSEQAYRQNSALQAQAAQETLARMKAQWSHEEWLKAENQKEVDDLIALAYPNSTPAERAQIKLGLSGGKGKGDGGETMTDEDNSVNYELTKVNDLILNGNFDQALEQINQIRQTIGGFDSELSLKLSSKTKILIDQLEQKAKQGKQNWIEKQKNKAEKDRQEAEKKGSSGGGSF